MAVARVDWDSPSLLAQNRQRLLKSTRRKLREYETRFELSSDRVVAEVTAGHLRETAEICDWIIAYRTLQSLEHAR